MDTNENNTKQENNLTEHKETAQLLQKIKEKIAKDKQRTLLRQENSKQYKKLDMSK